MRFSRQSRAATSTRSRRVRTTTRRLGPSRRNRHLHRHQRIRRRGRIGSCRRRGCPNHPLGVGRTSRRESETSPLRSKTFWCIRKPPFRWLFSPSAIHRRSVDTATCFLSRSLLWTADTRTRVSHVRRIFCCFFIKTAGFLKAAPFAAGAHVGSSCTICGLRSARRKRIAMVNPNIYTG